MNIRQKARIRGKVVYHVTCPNCNHSFKQIGRPYNFFRDIKKRYKLDYKQIEELERAMIRKYCKTGDTGEALLYEDSHTLHAGDMIFIKPQKRS